jgi:hypothetical protein
VAFAAPLPPEVGEQTLRAPTRTGDVSSAPAPIELSEE